MEMSNLLKTPKETMHLVQRKIASILSVYFVSANRWMNSKNQPIFKKRRHLLNMIKKHMIMEK